MPFKPFQDFRKRVRNRHLLGRQTSRKPGHLAAAAGLSVEWLEERILLATLTVTSTDDTGDGSLRSAIEQANANAGDDTIEFDIKSHDARFQDVDSHLAGGDADPDVFVIEPESPLPALTDDGTTIDGWSQTATGDTNPFGPEIVLDGNQLASGAIGLSVLSNDNAIAGLNIQQFSWRDIEVSGGDSNWITGNYLGTDATGTEAAGVGSATGIVLRDGAARNLIGTNGDRKADDSEGNVISGNGKGIEVLGIDADGNRIAGNFIGTDGTGTVSLDNESSGIVVHGAQGILIGTDGDGVADAAERNVVSGNGGNGIQLSGDTSGNAIAGNYIGTTSDGVSALGNDRDGIYIAGAHNNLVGTDGSDDAFNASERNVIASNGRDAIHLNGGAMTHNNTIAGNYLGIAADGETPLGHQKHEVYPWYVAAGNHIGTNAGWPRRCG